MSLAPPIRVMYLIDSAHDHTHRVNPPHPFAHSPIRPASRPITIQAPPSGHADANPFLGRWEARGRGQAGAENTKGWVVRPHLVSSFFAVGIVADVVFAAGKGQGEAIDAAALISLRGPIFGIVKGDFFRPVNSSANREHDSATASWQDVNMIVGNGACMGLGQARRWQ
jgi:hypothetical protein